MTLRWLATMGFFALCLDPAVAQANRERPGAVAEVDVIEAIDTPLDKTMSLTDHRGETVTLGDFFDGTRPVILTMNYYRCGTLCDLMLHELAKTLARSQWPPGGQYRVVTVGIDPRETAKDAARRRNLVLSPKQRDEFDWSFVVAAAPAIERLADTVGFRLRYHQDSDQWAHPAAIVIASPDGRIKAYRYGVRFPARTLRFSLLDAAEGSVGSVADRVVLSCFRYDDLTGRYVPYAWGVMRIGASLFALLLFAGLAVLWRREARPPKGGG